MRRRTVLKAMAAGTVAVYSGARLGAMQAMAPPMRRLLVYVDPTLASSIRDSVEKAVDGTQPLLRELSEGRAPILAGSSDLARNNFEQLWFNHLILVGLPNDPIVRAAWQREAHFEQAGAYIFGFGHLRGDIGYIESDRSPFLHSEYVRQSPFEAQVITITGSTPAGIRIALDAFAQRSLINGVIAAPGWMRSKPCLLDRDPLGSGFAIPDAPAQMGDLHLIGWTQAAEDEYRGVLADCGVSPASIWRAKYFRQGLWDSPGAAGSFDNYAAGLHRRAYGNTLWLAEFSSENEASLSAKRIAAVAHLQTSGAEHWQGNQLSYANNMYPGESKTQGSLTLTRNGRWLQMYALQQRMV
jgi:hypothetical protein